MATKLFSYRRESGAARTLRVLRERHKDTQFDLVLRPDWRFYIRATKPDGATGFVARAPLRAIASAAAHDARQ